MEKKKKYFILGLIVLIILISILSYVSILMENAGYYSFTLTEDTAIFLQKAWNGIHGKFFVSPEMDGAAFHHIDFLVVLIYGPLLLIFNTLFIMIYSSIILLFVPILIYLIFYISDKRLILFGFLASLAYLFNFFIIGNAIINKTFETSYLFSIFFPISIILYLKKKYNWAIIPLILSYFVNLETLPYFVIFFYLTVLLIARKELKEEEKRAIYSYIVYTLVYILLFHFVLYGYFVRQPGTNVYEYYYSLRAANGQKENPIIDLISNAMNLTKDKEEYIFDILYFLPPFSFNLINLYNILMGISASKEFYLNYVGITSHYNDSLPLFTVLLLFFYLYYKRPNKNIRYIIYAIIIFTLIYEMTFTIPIIIQAYNYAIGTLSDPEYKPIWNELLYIKSHYIYNNESITADPEQAVIFYKDTVVVFLPMVFDSNTCQIVDHYADSTSIDISLTYYYLFPLFYENYYNCTESTLIKNMENRGYILVYKGKYFLLFRLENASEAYNGYPVIDLSKILMRI